MKKKQFLAMLMATVTLLGAPMSVCANEVDASSGSATGGTDTSFEATADVLGGGLTVLVPDEMELMYVENAEVYGNSSEVIAKGYVEVDKYLDVSVLTDVTYTLDGFESITANGTVLFGIEDDVFQVETWTQEELKTKNADDGTLEGVAKYITVTVPKENVSDIGTYSSEIVFNIELKENNPLAFNLLDSGDAYEVVGSDAEMYEKLGIATVSIPSEYNGLPVTKIGGSAFNAWLDSVDDSLNGFSNITEIIIPESVTSIDELAFSGTSVTSITLPDNLTEIGSSSFKQADFLTSVIYKDVEYTSNQDLLNALAANGVLDIETGEVIAVLSW